MVPSTRIERVTYPLGKGRSIQLSYEGPNVFGSKLKLNYRVDRYVFQFLAAVQKG
jgi:hypothetical protein